MTSSKLRLQAITSLATVAALTAGCSGSGDLSTPASLGGAVSTGGTVAAAGGTNTGGAGQSGGTSGIKQSGGSSAASGGAGTSGTGGKAATGGQSSVGTGGVVTTGGAPTATGGKSATGGAATGGTRTGAGGALPTGGAPANTGGTQSSVGGGGGIGSCAAPATGHYQMEDVDRGVVAVKVTGGVYVGWRMMGYEYNPTSPSSVAYNLYRDGTKLTSVTNSTNYLDSSGTTSSTYSVSAVIGGTECPQSAATSTWSQNYVSIPLTPPANSSSGATYSANDAAPGDLDGDGKYDIVLKWDPSDSKDNSQSGNTSDVFIDGYTLAGKRLWRIDLGPNIRAGQHYTQLSVYDFDGDGKAEVVCKTAPGTKDGTGAYLSKGPAASDDDSAVLRNGSGYILTGAEYLTVFDGTTGKELATVNYPVPRGSVDAWGDNYGNRVDRFNGGFAFVKDAGTATGRPSIIQQRGYYTRLTVSALTWRDGTLATNWIFDSDKSGNGSANGQGCHSAMAGDTNSDGAQEVITGATTIASNGTLQCTTKMGHGDALHVGELIEGKGLTVYQVHEGTGGEDAHNAATCEFYFNTTGSGDNGRGVADYIAASNTTSATCSSAVDGDKNCQSGAATSPGAGGNFVIYWDADESRELENGTSITKAGGGTLLSASGCASNNGTKSVPTLTADLLGDWREEIVYRTSDNTALRVYTTTAVTTRRIYTLMHDPTYRAQVSFEQSSYNQPPHPGFKIGASMKDPPKPDIYVK